MMLNDLGIVLWRRDAGEYDRRVVLLTERHGALAARFGGVNRSAGKLKALSEPMVWGEYRLYFSPRSGAVRVIGGRLLSSFPAVRRDLRATLRALAMCEMALRLSPIGSASPEKYRLLQRSLAALEAGPADWLEAGFGLKLLELAG
ncbi:MAG: DNA repair protein RecO, partial [Elusimicrobia bacterium]|nr:DNA repair protein RecO [Elusimicrobiota bacterium]